MTQTNLLTNLKNRQYNTSVLEEYIAEHRDDEEDTFLKELRHLLLPQLCGVIKLCELFRQYFDENEFSKLVCKTVISFTKLHAAALSAHSIYPELNVKRFANPNRELPKFFYAWCSPNGLVTYCNCYGGPFIEAK